MNKSVSQETFGVDPSNQKVVGGKICLFGHTVKDGQPIPDRGTSVNSKTGYPAKPVK